jgi:hypothetical protein
MPMQDGHPDGQATPDPSTTTKDGSQTAKPRPTLVTWHPRRARPLGASHGGGASQAKVTLNRHSTRAEGSNKNAPANQEQMDCRSTTGAHTDL